MTMGVAEAEAVAILVEEQLERSAKMAEADISKKQTKIHRFPVSMRSLGNDGGYVVPNVVAIGPYHRHHRHLRQAEETKRVAAYYFCRDSGHPAKEVYGRIFSVAGEARSCYDDDATDGISEAEFAAMMFHDGCFLVQFMLSYTGEEVAPALESLINVMTNIARDVFLLENQIPLLVLHALMEFRPVLVDKFIVNMALTFYMDLGQQVKRRILTLSSITIWPHLLELLRCCVSGSVSDGESPVVLAPSPTSSAIELGQIGIKLTASRTAELKDMGIKRGPLFGKLFLTPFLMGNKGTCWLVNMVALERCIAVTWDANCTAVGSYIAAMAMLMNREEDVHELRAKGLVYGRFSDQETLQFFKTLYKHTHMGPRYVHILQDIESYRRERWLWIACHKFVYNNIKTIVTVFTVVGVLVGIFKTLLNIKQHKL
ncbi:hypothetical protein GUJ93_ZPchr0010g8107 [Zizania palustris]|uniref:Uncharacterized protein n=1 Tax=Zizania palustris TaxID=103762 RepID=A0A8J5WCF3_ZIZPA|nr:hypothetical protein GUJ93_ZPchr0010g8107 [Zizania palustris]